MKFKVGDKVRIIAPPEGKYNGWDIDLIKIRGEVAIITTVLKNPILTLYEVLGFCLPEDCLAAVTDSQIKLTVADLKAICDEAQSMMGQIESKNRMEDYEYWFNVYNSAEEQLHKEIKVIYPLA